MRRGRKEGGRVQDVWDLALKEKEFKIAPVHNNNFFPPKEMIRERLKNKC